MTVSGCSGSVRHARIRFSLVAILILIASTCFAFGWWFVQPSHVAQAYLQVTDAKAGSSSTDVFRQTQRALITSTFVLNSALSRKAIMELDCVARQEDPGHWLRDDLEVTFPGDGDVMELSLAGREADMPEYCRLIDAIIDSYRNEVVHRERMEREEAREAQSASANRVGKELKEKVDRLHNLIRELGGKEAGESGEVALMRAEIEALTDVWKELQTQLLSQHFNEKLLRAQLRLLQPATASKK